MKLRGWITLGLVLLYGLWRSEVIAHADDTFLAQLAPTEAWVQWRSWLTSTQFSDETMLWLAAGAFVLGMLGVWWQPMIVGVRSFFVSKSPTQKQR